MRMNDQGKSFLFLPAIHLHLSGTAVMFFLLLLHVCCISEYIIFALDVATTAADKKKVSPLEEPRPLLSLSSLSSKSLEEHESTKNIDENKKCRLYLAKSLYPAPPEQEEADEDINNDTSQTDDKTGKTSSSLGIFTAIDLPVNTAVGNAEIAIPLVDLHRHASSSVIDEGLFWRSADIYANEDEYGIYGPGGLALVPGVGMTGNYMCDTLANMEWDYLSPVNRYRISPVPDTSGKDERERDNGRISATGNLDWREKPGAGAITEYFNMVARTTRSIPAGSELFLDSFSGEDATGLLTSKLREALSIIEGFAKVKGDHPEHFTIEHQLSIWEMLRRDVVTDPMVRHFLPSDIEGVGEIASRITDDENSDGSSDGESTADGKEDQEDQNEKPKRQLKSFSPGRSLDWLEKNGQCMDNLIAKRSTLSGAGRGAFATRFIPKGTLVAPGPLVRFSRAELSLYTKEDEDDEEDGSPFDGDIYQEQLLLNYCFYHRDSSILLYPYSSITNFINHKSSDDYSDNNNDGPNAEIRWSTSSNHEASLTSLPVEELIKGERRFGLMFDFIATRDIKEGEEVFIDYGEEWSVSWKEFSESWSSPHKDEYDAHIRPPPTASILNDENAPFPTKMEREKNQHTFFEDIRIWCTKRNDSEMKNEPDQDDRIFEEGHRGSSSSAIHEWSKVTFIDGECEVLKRTRIEERGNESDGNHNDYVYLVRVLTSSEKYPQVPYYIKNVPHNAMIYVDVPYMSAMHMQNAFRHPIAIPDSIFPQSWTDMKHVH